MVETEPENPEGDGAEAPNESCQASKGKETSEERQGRRERPVTYSNFWSTRLWFNRRPPGR